MAGRVLRNKEARWRVAKVRSATEQISLTDRYLSCSRSALLDRHGVQIRILGRRDLLPPDVQGACAKAEAMTAHNKRYGPVPPPTSPTIVALIWSWSTLCRGILNFCCPYTSQEEMATAMKRTVDGCVAGEMDPR